MPTDEPRKRSLNILERCLSLHGEEGTTRAERLDELLATFVLANNGTANPMECAEGWYFCVPPSFRSALDIQLTTRVIDGQQKELWTQGSTFHFAAGDAIYDSPAAYLAWDLRFFNFCLDIRRASPAEPTKAKKPRQPGTVIFDILVPTPQKTALEKRRETVLTQDAFVRLLIEGPPQGWIDAS